MSGFRRVLRDGEIVLVPNDPTPALKNPPLTALNQAYREAEAKRREEIGETLEVAQSAFRTALTARNGRRMQKPLRAPPVV